MRCPSGAAGVAPLEVEMWDVEELVIAQKHTVKFLRK